MALKVLNSEYSSDQKLSEENKLLNDSRNKATSEVNIKPNHHSASQKDRLFSESNFETFRNKIDTKSKELLDRPSNEQSIPNDDKADSEVEKNLDDPDEYIDNDFEEEKLNSELKPLHPQEEKQNEIHPQNENLETKFFDEEIVDDMESVKLTNKNSKDNSEVADDEMDYNEVYDDMSDNQIANHEINDVEIDNSKVDNKIDDKINNMELINESDVEYSHRNKETSKISDDIIQPENKIIKTANIKTERPPIPKPPK